MTSGLSAPIIDRPTQSTSWSNRANGMRKRYRANDFASITGRSLRPVCKLTKNGKPVSCLKGILV